MKRLLVLIVALCICGMLAILLGGCVNARWTQNTDGSSTISYTRFFAGADSLAVDIKDGDKKKATVAVNGQKYDTAIALQALQLATSLAAPAAAAAKVVP